MRNTLFLGLELVLVPCTNQAGVPEMDRDTGGMDSPDIDTQDRLQTGRRCSQYPESQSGDDRSGLNVVCVEQMVPGVVMLEMQIRALVMFCDLAADGSVAGAR